MQVPITQIWEYEFKPTDTLRVLHAFYNEWKASGSEIELQNKGGKLYAIRKENGNR
jgi:hypothetical protein